MTMKNKDHQLLSYDDGYDTDAREEELEQDTSNEDASTDESDTENNLLLRDTTYRKYKLFYIYPFTHNKLESEQSQRGNKVNSSPFAVAPSR